jgi:beta-glucanase (GH16 family)
LPGRIDFFIDGINTFSERKLPGETWREWPFDQDFYFVINLAVGGTLGGPVDPAALPAHLEVDYIRVYQPTRLEDCHELP